jgi:hypothetical protein
MAIKQDNTTKLELPFTTADKAEFVATGLFKPEWFPGAKGNGKKEVTIDGDELRSVIFDQTVEKLKITRSDESRGLFDVEIVYTEEERMRRDRLSKEHFMENAYKEASTVANDQIERLPDSVESFRRHGAWRMEQMIDIQFNGLVSDRGGYSFDKKTVQSFNNTVAVLCDILKKGGVEFEQFAQDDERRNIIKDAFNRGICLGLTGYERDVLIRRFVSELSALVVKATETAHV